MMTSPWLALVIPIFNEQKNLHELIAAVWQSVPIWINPSRSSSWTMAVVTHRQR